MSIKNWLILAAALAVAPTLAATASAEPSAFATNSGVLLSADRLVVVGQAVDSRVSTDSSFTSVNSLNVFGAWATSPSPLCDPRLGIDRVFGSGWTSGASLALSFVGGKQEVTKANVTSSEDLTSAQTLLVTPRAGYLLGLSPKITLWLRAGLSLISSESKDKDGTYSNSYSGFNLTIDPQLLITPNDSFALALGLVADLPLSGKQTLMSSSGGISSSVEREATFRFIGATLGLVGKF